jgi:hypothetical protein
MNRVFPFPQRIPHLWLRALATKCALTLRQWVVIRDDAGPPSFIPILATNPMGVDKNHTVPKGGIRPLPDHPSPGLADKLDVVGLRISLAACQ